MMRRTWYLPVLALGVLVLGAAGCETATTPDQPTASQATNESTEGTKPGPVSLDVTIIDGEVMPRGARIELRVGQPLTLSVHSDTADELHVHTDPEQEFAVKAQSNQRFTFRVDRPSKVAVELHQLDVVIAELLVRK
jgi:hypothetical protein